MKFPEQEIRHKKKAMIKDIMRSGKEGKRLSNVVREL